MITRKNTADIQLTALVKLLIIDEVHLLHDSRGSVIETLVARTLRQVGGGGACGGVGGACVVVGGACVVVGDYLSMSRWLVVCGRVLSG